MSSADAPSAAVRTMTPPVDGAIPLRISLSRVPLAVLEPARDAEPLAVRDVDEEAPGQRDLGRQARALRLHRVLHRLHEDLLAALDQVGDLLPVPLALELGDDDLVDVEEAVLLEPDLDEGRLHAGQHVVDAAEVDVPGDRAALGPLEVDLGDAVVLEQRDALLADVDRDQELALRLRQRRAPRRPAAAAHARRERLTASGSASRFSDGRPLSRGRLVRRRRRAVVPGLVRLRRSCRGFVAHFPRDSRGAGACARQRASVGVVSSCSSASSAASSSGGAGVSSGAATASAACVVLASSKSKPGQSSCLLVLARAGARPQERSASRSVGCQNPRPWPDARLSALGRPVGATTAQAAAGRSRARRARTARRRWESRAHAQGSSSW